MKGSPFYAMFAQNLLEVLKVLGMMELAGKARKRRFLIIHSHLSIDFEATEQLKVWLSTNFEYTLASTVLTLPLALARARY